MIKDAEAPVRFSLQQLDDDLASIVQGALPSLVRLENGRSGAGAGVIVHADGLIVTNAHVAQRRSPNVVLWDGHRLPGRLLAYDEQHDLAALNVDAHDLPVLEMGDSRTLAPGHWVVALGHPWGVNGAATAGMVIDVGRPAQALPYTGPLIQVGLHLRPGHSGGPMLDSRGQLIGINTMISGPHVGLAIPVQTVKRFLKRALGSSPSRRRDTRQLQKTI